MNRADLSGHSILVIEDHFVIAMDVADSLRQAGARVMVANSLCEGLRLAGHPQLSAAVVDYGLSDGDGAALCESLDQRGVPFVLHTGFARVPEVCRTGVVVTKPAPSRHIVATIEKLVRSADR